MGPQLPAAALQGDEPWLFGGGGDLRALRQAAAFVGSPATAASGGMRWFPQYGAALVALPPHSTQAVPGEAWLSVMALDGWEFRPHRWVTWLGQQHAVWRAVPRCPATAVAVLPRPAE